MALSWEEFSATGGQTTVAVNVAYLDKSDIHLEINDSEITGFTWASDTLITLPNTTTVATGDKLAIIRKTDRTALRLLFSEGAAFTRDNIDEQNDQFLYLAQELVEGRSIDGFYGDISMNGYRITKLGEPIDSSDAATRNYVDISINAVTGGVSLSLKHTLRFSEEVDAGPTASARKNSLLGFNSNSQPVPIFSMTETADLAIKLASQEEGLGSSLIGVDQGMTLQDYLDKLTGDITVPYGQIKNVVRWYSPEMFLSDNVDVNSITDWSAYINLAITTARADGIGKVVGADIYPVASPIYVDNFNTGFSLDIAGLSATTEWATYSDWKTASALVVVGAKSNGSQVGLDIKVGFAYGRDLATLYSLQGYGAGGSRFYIGRGRNCVGIFDSTQSSKSVSGSNYLCGGYVYDGIYGVRAKRNGRFVCEGLKVQVGFITNMRYGGIQFYNGTQYFQINQTDMDFNGKYLAELTVDVAPASDIRGSNLVWNGTSYEVVDYYQIRRGAYRILVIDSQSTVGGNSTIKPATSTALSDGTTTYVLSSVRTPTLNQFYFDFIHGFEGSPFAKGEAHFGYLGGFVGGLTRSSFLYWHNGYDENSNTLNDIWIRNQSNAVGIYDKWSNSALITFATMGTTPTTNLSGQLNVAGVSALTGGAYLATSRIYGSERLVTLVSGTSQTIRTFNFVGDGTSTATKEVWEIEVAGPVGVSGTGGRFEVHVGNSGIELKNTSSVSYPTLSASGYALNAVQSAQPSLAFMFMFKRVL